MKDDWKTVFPSEVIAIDILLQPGATMLQHAADNNARLLKEYPQCFALDAAHTPHITMLQCFVRKADLEALYAAEEKVLAAAKVTAMKLEAFKLYYIPAGGGLGVAGICAKPTPDFPKPIEAPKGVPNILVILTDDVGFGASSTFGGPIPTPTMDRLAKNGLR